MSEFDWYQATIRQPGADVQAELLGAFVDSWLEPTTIRVGYGEAYALRDSEGRRCVVQQGGHNAWPNVTFSGEDAPAGRDFLRARFPTHEVTRADSRIDMDGPGTWEKISAIGLEVADARGVRVSMYGDWREGRGEAGRTLYLGATSSAVRVRIYEKGKELRAKRAPGASIVPLDAVRAEIQARPSGPARSYASLMSPDDVWGFAAFAQQLHERITSSGVQLIDIRDVRPSNDDRALDFMALQYGRMLRRQEARLGSMNAVWARVESLMLAHEARRA